MRNGRVKKIALLGLLFALACALSFVESMLLPWLGLPPGVKIGLANIVVMFAMLTIGKESALFLTILKSAFAFLTRGAAAGLLSLGGGLLAYFVMLLFCRRAKKPSLFLLSTGSAIAHNLGQLLVLKLMMCSAYALYYLPVLLVSGLAMGSLTAYCLKLLGPALQRFGYKNQGSK